MLHRESYKADFVKDERAPLNLEDFEHVHYYKPNKAYDCECSFQNTPKSIPFDMATYSGKTKAFKKYGEIN